MRSLFFWRGGMFVYEACVIECACAHFIFCTSGNMNVNIRR